MSIVEELGAEDVKHEILNSVQIAREAELNDDPMQNEEKSESDIPKNNHFEHQFGGDDSPPVYVYIERYNIETGIEVMVWADTEWFENDETDSKWPEIEDGGEELEQFANNLLELIGDELSKENIPEFEYQQYSGSSVVFNAIFIL